MDREDLYLTELVQDNALRCGVCTKMNWFRIRCSGAGIGAELKWFRIICPGTGFVLGKFRISC
jgi:hypothetical protein